MPGFAQIIDFRTARFEEGQKLVDEYRAKTKGTGGPGRAMVLQDRDDPSHYFTVVEFESYEAAMKNNELPETQELAAGLAALSDGPQTFYNLDVKRVEED